MWHGRPHAKSYRVHNSANSAYVSYRVHNSAYVVDNPGLHAERYRRGQEHRQPVDARFIAKSGSANGHVFETGLAP
jgi:hypothetical protein